MALTKNRRAVATESLAAIGAESERALRGNGVLPVAEQFDSGIEFAQIEERRSTRRKSRTLLRGANAPVASGKVSLDSPRETFLEELPLISPRRKEKIAPSRD